MPDWDHFHDALLTTIEVDLESKTARLSLSRGGCEYELVAISASAVHCPMLSPWGLHVFPAVNDLMEPVLLGDDHWLLRVEMTSGDEIRLEAARFELTTARGA